MKICAWLARFLCTTCVIFLSTLNIVDAHSDLMTATPAPGEQLSTIPGEVRLEFSSALRPESRFALADANFQFIPDIQAQIRGDNRNLLVAEIPLLAPGIYTVHWVSVGEDGDFLRGSYSFSVRQDAQRESNISLYLRQNGLIAGVLLSLLVVGCVWLSRFYRKNQQN